MKTQITSTQEQQQMPLQRIQKEPGMRGTGTIEDYRSGTVVQRQLQETMHAHSGDHRGAIQRKKNPEPGRRNNTGLPDHLKSGIENLSGYNMDDVKVYYNSSKPAQLQAHAYAQGTDIHLASGQEKHLPHEAWHVVQQKQGRVKPTRQLKSKVNINDDKGLEKEADVMGRRATQATNDMLVEPMQLKISKPLVYSVFQRYKTKKEGLTVAGELHNKTSNHREIEGEFAKHIKNQEVNIESAKYMWTENEMPGSKEGENIKKSENSKYLAISDIDRIKYYYGILLEELEKDTDASHAEIMVCINAIITAKSEISNDLNNAGIKDEILHLKIQNMKNHDFTQFLVLCMDDFKDEERKIFLEKKNKEEFFEIIGEIDEIISKEIVDIPKGREISHNFIRSRAMHELANEKNSIPGVWLIGQYHVQEIQEHFRSNIQYDLVSIFDFNEDIRVFSKSIEGNKENQLGDRMGEISVAARLIRSSIDDLKTENRDDVDVLFHLERLKDSIYVLHYINKNDSKINKNIEEMIKEINNRFAFLILFMTVKDKKPFNDPRWIKNFFRNNNFEIVSELEKLSKTAK